MSEEQIAAHDMCAAFCAAEPDQTATLLFGAAAWLQIETRLNAHLIECWEQGRTTTYQATGAAQQGGPGTVQPADR